MLLPFHVYVCVCSSFGFALTSVERLVDAEFTAALQRSRLLATTVIAQVSMHAPVHPPACMCACRFMHVWMHGPFWQPDHSIELGGWASADTLIRHRGLVSAAVYWRLPNAPWTTEPWARLRRVLTDMGIAEWHSVGGCPMLDFGFLIDREVEGGMRHGPDGRLTFAADCHQYLSPIEGGQTRKAV